MSGIGAAAAGFGIGAADAFGTGLFLAPDVKDSCADDSGDHSEDEKICHRLTSFR